MGKDQTKVWGAWLSWPQAQIWLFWMRICRIKKTKMIRLGLQGFRSKFVKPLSTWSNTKLKKTRTKQMFEKVIFRQLKARQIESIFITFSCKIRSLSDELLMTGNLAPYLRHPEFAEFQSSWPRRKKAHTSDPSDFVYLEWQVRVSSGSSESRLCHLSTLS